MFRPCDKLPHAPSGTIDRAGVWGRQMTSKSVDLRPGMNRPLRLARVYGFLLGGKDGLYYPGSGQPICTMAVAQKMVEGGWLERRGERYELTEHGRQAAE
jgi:hypothetical protein